MGDGAEDRLTRTHPEVFGEPRRPRRETHSYYPTWAFNTETWTTKDGDTIKLEDMTSLHRGHTVDMLRRRYGAQINSAPLVKRMLELGVES